MKIDVEGAIQLHGHPTQSTVKSDDMMNIPERVIDRLALMFQDAKMSCRRARLLKRAIYYLSR